MVDKETSPTIEQSLRMIEEKLKDKKIGGKKESTLSKGNNKNKLLSNLFKKKIKLKKNKDEKPFLLTNKVDDKKNVIKKNKVKVEKKDSQIEKKINLKKEQINKKELTIKNYKNLNKTTELAIIIKKIKNIRDKKLKIYNKNKPNRVYKEIKKLNEAIDLSEDLFKKELLDL